MKEYYNEKLRLARMELEIIESKAVEELHNITMRESYLLSFDAIVKKIDDYRTLRDEVKSQIEFYLDRLGQLE